MDRPPDLERRTGSVSAKSSESFLRGQALLAAIAAATQPLVEPSEIMKTTARLLAEHLDVDRCAYAEVEDESCFVITGDYARGVPSIVGRWPVAAFGPACVRCMLAGKPYIVDDVDQHPEIGPEHLPAYRATTIRAVICLPLHKEGRFTAAMAVHQTYARHWTPEEIELVGLVVARCWEALERARVVRALRESEARYRIIVEASPDCVSVIARSGELVQINAAGLRMLDASDASQVLGRDVTAWISREHREAFRAFNERTCRGENGTLGLELVSLAGVRRWVEITAVPLPAASGGFHQLAVARDVTARVAAERALSENRARLDYAVRLSGIGFWYCDLPFEELIWDEQVRSHFFLTRDARVTLETFFARIHPEDRVATERAINDSIAKRVPYDIIYRTVDPASGTTKWIRALGGAAYKPDGSPARFDGVTVDVSAQKLDQERLAEVLERERALNEQLREQDRRKDEFLATLAHELRNPLAPIRTGLHVLRMTGDGAQAQKTREMMERQLGHMVRMVDDLLDVSRITLGKLELKRATIDFRSVLHSAVETTRALIEAAGHEFAVRLPKDPLPLHVDPTRLSQVFANLLNNAAKYTPPGGRIQLSAELEANWLVVRVSDSGVGIPREMLPKIFELFTQVGHSMDRSQGGLGIGLMLVRRLLELHGGSVDAESTGANAGSTFTVRLPLSRAGTAPEQVAESASEPRRVAALRVLVVDDNVDGAEALALLIELNGHEARLAHDGRQALSAAAEFQPHVVFLDIGLPEMNGYEVARVIRSQSLRPRPTLVALTGWGTEEDRRQAQAAGFDHHLVKPADSPKVIGVLAQAAEQQAESQPER